MSTKTKVTLEAIRDAIAQLKSSNQHPSCERIRQLIGGGSYTSITAVLKQLQDSAPDGAAPPAEFPDALKSAGVELARTLYNQIHRSATEAILVARREADAAVAAAHATLAEAQAEIQRLEHEQDRLDQALTQATAEKQDALERAAQACTVADERSDQLKRAHTEVSRAQRAERKALADATAVKKLIVALQARIDSKSLPAAKRRR